MITKYPGKITKNLPAGPVRGSMTAQDLTRLNRDVIGEIREMHPLLTPKPPENTSEPTRNPGRGRDEGGEKKASKEKPGADHEKTETAR